MGLIGNVRYKQSPESNGTVGSSQSHSNQTSSQPMIPLWAALLSVFFFIACAVILLLYLYRYRREQRGLKLHHESASVLLRPIKVSTQCQRPWQQMQYDRRLSGLSSQAMEVSSIPGIRAVMANQLEEAGITYNGDMSSADSSPSSSPKVMDSKTVPHLGLFETPPPPLSGESISQIGTSNSGRLPYVLRQLALAGRKGSLCRSQSLDSLSTDRSLVRTPSRQGSENDLTHLSVQNTSSRPTSDPGSTEIAHSHQSSFGPEGNFIRFTVQYNSHSMRLLVNVIKCYSNMLGRDKELSHKPSLFATVCLLPDCRVKYQTRVHYQMLHPQFNEQFTFTDVTFTALSKRHILLAVYNYEGKSQTLVGCCDVPLQQVSVTGKPTIFYEQLQLTKMAKLKFDPKKLPTAGGGDLLISLVYMNHMDKLSVIVMKGRNFHHPDAIGQLDSYCEVQLLVDGVKSQQKMTSVKKRTMNPVWNEALQLDLSGRDLADLSVVVLVNATDMLTRSYEIGRVEIGCRGSPAAQGQWQKVLENPRRQSAEWHEIRS